MVETLLIKRSSFRMEKKKVVEWNVQVHTDVQGHPDKYEDN